MNSEPLIITEQKSPCGEDLELTLIVGKEGISDSVDVYEGAMFYQEWAEHFSVEKDSKELDESLKMQRDIIPSRISKLKKTFSERTNTSFPSISIFVTKVEVIETIAIGNKTVVRVLIRADTGRFITDGQHRTVNTKIQLFELNRTDLSNHTIGMKLCVTNTESIYDAREIIEQQFSDFNGRSQKPNSSVNKFYDTSSNLGRLMKDIVTSEIEGVGQIKDVVAVQGNLKSGKVYTFDQLRNFVFKAIGKTETEIEKLLQDDPESRSIFTDGVRKVINGTFKHLPFRLMHEPNWKKKKDEMLFTKAIFCEGLAMAANCYSTQCATQNTPINWDIFAGIEDVLPICDKADPLWKETGVTIHKQSDGKTNVTINKNGGSRKIALIICNALDIKPSLTLTL
ncbi:DGQHR domain-containing protein [Vibrio parahaemolyticus]|jgi:DGQHR domain-containing protein|uniref:DGQHR domain-containing protein n=1 Tax=Vibrio TaxID=662 RepID=UPI00215D1F7A|nr:DNA sulfur modification protein DndB [Vibrio parahaemolyticus]MCR9887968.1 DGQHR domain-containing protein [Vibrio parahaemolyticus]MCR9918181.1 DGQHR domain-containing protein [Vibrio parahaemolyticus]